MELALLPRQTPEEGFSQRVIGQKFYELNDHLGNIRVVLSDIKISNVAELSIGQLPSTFRIDLQKYANY